MGLFSSKKKTTVDTSISRVIKDSLLPDSPKQGVISALFAGDDQMAEHILERVVNSIGVKAERMYQYGKKTYLYGLPNSTLFTNTTGEEVAQAAIESELGQEVTLDYYHFGALNNLHYGWLTLVNSYGYRQATNELTVLSATKGAPVYLNDLQVVVVQATAEEMQNGSLDQWGTPATAGYTPLRPAQLSGSWGTVRKPTPFAKDSTASNDYFRLSYLWKSGGILHQETLQFLMSLEDPTLDYFQVKYSYVPSGQTLPLHKYWTYRSGAGTWPALDELFTSEHDNLGSFFPIGYFRYNKTPTSTDVTSTEYKHSKKLLKYLDMDYDSVRDSINENPDIADVESALVMLAVPAITSNGMEQRYLFDFFKSLYQKTGKIHYSVAEMSYENTYWTEDRSQISLVIQDARFKMALRLSGLYRRIRVGTLGAKGTYTSGFDTSRTITEQGIQYVDEYDLVGTPYEITYTAPCHYYRHQVADNLYEEIEVYALQSVYYISGNYADTAFEQDPVLLIPLDHGITEHYSASEREQLYARSLHYLFNTKIVTKVKWYQSTFFKFVMIVVAVVISILSFNPGPMMAAIAAGGMVLATFIATAILEGLLFSLAFKLFVKIVGAKFAMLIAVVAAVYSLGSGMMNGGSLEGVPWGEELLQISSGISKAVNDSIQGEMKELQKEMGEFQSFVEDQNAALEKANALLENQNLLSPFVVFGESPTDYYERTTHSGNIGVIGLDAVTSYCDVALTLPKLSQTLGDSFNTETFDFNNLG